MRRPLIAANWKMHMTVSEALGFLDEFLTEVKSVTDRDIVIAPPFTALKAAGERLEGTNVLLSAQNVFYEVKGAFTGEVSPLMLKDAGCRYVIVGHSERRQHFGETDETANKRARAALKEGLGVIFCIGETKEERMGERTFEVLQRQVSGGMGGLDTGGLAVAYEPVWAIGTGLTATSAQAEEAHSFIRGRLEGLFGSAGADGIRILYGGSVKPENIDELMACPNVDGALVGGASLNAASFAKIVKYKI